MRWRLARLCVGAPLLLACADPTAIDVTVYSEVPCSAQAEVAISLASDPASLPAAAPAAVSTQCEAARDGSMLRGSVVIVPQGDREKSVTFQLTTRSDAQPLDACATDPANCIAARRELRFQPKKTTQVRVDLRLACLGVACALDQTCVRGTCVSAQLQPCDSCGEPDAGVSAPNPPSGVALVASAVGSVSTLAGSGNSAFADGTGVAASFSFPYGVAVDGAGVLYIVDGYNNRIRKVTSQGVTTTLAGSGAAAFADGAGSAASFNYPQGISVDLAGDKIYVADFMNNRIRQLDSAGVVTTLAGTGAIFPFADGPGNTSTFFAPTGVAVDATGNVYVADNPNCRVRAVTPAGVVSTLAGQQNCGHVDATGSLAEFYKPMGVAVDSAGNVFVADETNNMVRKVTSGGVVTTLAGSGAMGRADGVGAAATFSGPFGVAVDAVGTVYVADSANHLIRKVTSAGVVTTLAGSGSPGYADGIGALASFSGPCGVGLDKSGLLYVTDTSNHRIRVVTTAGGSLLVSWAPNAAGESVTGYVASASAAGQPTETCASTTATTCTIRGLSSGVAYGVTVTATSAFGTSAPSTPVMGTPN